MSRVLSALLTAVLLICSPAAAMDIRRVVTGLDANGKSTATFDNRVVLAPVPGDLGLANLWVTDTNPPEFSFQSDTISKSVGISPPDNGTQFGVVEFPPFDPTNPAKPLWHRTRTLDYVVAMSGEIDLMLDEQVVHLKAGDTIVQQATNHAWLNRGKEPCRLLVVLLDAKKQK